MKAKHVQSAPASTRLLREQLAACSAQLEQAKILLLAIVKTLGRVRVEHTTLSTIQNGDEIVGREIEGAVVFTFVPTNMVAGPAGVKNGKSLEPNGAA